MSQEKHMQKERLRINNNERKNSTNYKLQTRRPRILDPKNLFESFDSGLKDARTPPKQHS